MYSPRRYGFETVTPGGYASLMDVYENNYLRLKRLINPLEAFQGAAVSQVAGCMDLHICVVERSRYTTTLNLSYQFADSAHPHAHRVAEPDLMIRIYHDAGLVEVIAGHLRHGRVRLNHLPSQSLKVKWKLNRFLFRWLGFCLHLGHGIALRAVDYDARHHAAQLAALQTE
jgi:uncharacterized protein YqiB (DUF1249 family)